MTEHDDELEWVPPRFALTATLGAPGKQRTKLHDGYWQAKDPAKRTGKEEVMAAIMATPS